MTTFRHLREILLADFKGENNVYALRERTRFMNQLLAYACSCFRHESSKRLLNNKSLFQSVICTNVQCFYFL